MASLVGKILRVTWLDAWFSDETQEIADITQDSQTITYGLCVKDEADFLVLVVDFYPTRTSVRRAYGIYKKDIVGKPLVLGTEVEFKK